ncbi:hypothetical protein K439DRAFT_1368114 [Ramaria rubella]|nr:hypothetical protein K439DRAFT_1368114 [Ramaria rubella]
MSLTVAPTVARGSAPLLQPFYYMSSLFVEPMREDVTSLLSAFASAYVGEPLEPEKPFELFKSIWKSEGWDLVHLKALDSRARVVFLQTVMRLLIERMDPVEHQLIRIGALFGLYTFYTIQPESDQTGIHPVKYITITMDAYENLLDFPGSLEPPLRSYVTYIISQLLSLEVFHIIPHSSLGAQNPRTLPHTMPLLTRDINHGQKKKTGRPSQLAQTQRGDSALSALETYLDQWGAQEPATSDSRTISSPSPSLPMHPSPNDYLVLKEQLRNTVSSEALKAAEALTMKRIQEAERHVADKNIPLRDREGLERLEKVSEQPHGLLGLLQRNTD